VIDRPEHSTRREVKNNWHDSKSWLRSSTRKERFC